MPHLAQSVSRGALALRRPALAGVVALGLAAGPAPVAPGLIALAPLLVIGGPAWAVTPGEQLADPGLEARAREISRLLRCPQCQSENIDESNAEIARDLRRLVRERLVAGDSNQQVIDQAVARYGEYVLFLPEARGINLLLWGAGPALLLLAIAVALLAGRQRRLTAPAVPDLTEAERRRLDELTGRN